MPQGYTFGITHVGPIGTRQGIRGWTILPREAGRIRSRALRGTPWRCGRAVVEDRREVGGKTERRLQPPHTPLRACRWCEKGLRRPRRSERHRDLVAGQLLRPAHGTVTASIEARVLG